MRTAVDTSVLLAILNGEPAGETWLDRLVECRRAGQVIVCEVVYAELARGFESAKELDAVLDQVGIAFEAINQTSAFCAGKAFSNYRTRGGPRTNLIPDFLIAAYGREQADQLAADDRGYFREYFKGLKVIGR